MSQRPNSTYVGSSRRPTQRGPDIGMNQARRRDCAAEESGWRGPVVQAGSKATQLLDGHPQRDGLFDTVNVTPFAPDLLTAASSDFATGEAFIEIVSLPRARASAARSCPTLNSPKSA
jgi:hypothetical protein